MSTSLPGSDSQVDFFIVKSCRVKVLPTPSSNKEEHVTKTNVYRYSVKKGQDEKKNLLILLVKQLSVTNYLKQCNYYTQKWPTYSHIQSNVLKSSGTAQSLKSCLDDML